MRIVVLIVLLAVLLVGGYLWQNRGTKEVPIVEETTQVYTSTSYGFSFTYPNTYVLEERELGSGERFHHNITLIDREAGANIPQNGEGPPSITIDVIQNDIDGLSVTEWVNNDSRSNFKLSPDSVLASTTVADREAVRYTWDGLYRGESVVFEHNGSIIMVSVSLFEPADTIRSNFAEILSSFQVN